MADTDGKRWISERRLQRFWNGIKSRFTSMHEEVESIKTFAHEEIGSYTTDWLDEHVDPVGSAVVVDDTLTISGAAADAKVAGDEIGDIKGALNTLEDVFQFDWELGALSSGGGLETDSNTRIRSDFVPVYNGTKISVSGNDNCLFVFLFSDDKTYLSESAWTDGNTFVVNNNSAALARILIRKDSSNTTMTSDDVSTQSARCSVIHQLPDDTFLLDSIVSDLRLDIATKVPKAYSGNLSTTILPVTAGKTWDSTQGMLTGNTKRAASRQIKVTPNMKSIEPKSGYVMLVYGNNEGAGNALTQIQTYTNNPVSIKGEISYKYIFVIIARNDLDVISAEEVSDVLKLNVYDELLYANEFTLNQDYYFVDEGKLVCANQPVNTSNNNVAKYARVDMGSDVKKVRCKFTQRGGGNVTLIATPLDTDNHVQNIVNKSIHCTFGMTSTSVQTFDNLTATTVESFTYTSLASDDETEYTIGFEIVNSSTFKVLTPDGQEHTISHDFTGHNGRYFIFETFKNSMDSSANPTTKWNRASIKSVYCKPTTGHAFRDDFKNYPNGHQPVVSPSGHVYTLFRNATNSDDTYVNANGTHDA